jgi:uncharacterized protein (TIRG00374 family)
MRGQLVRLLIGLGVSGVALYLAFRGVDWEGVFDALAEVDGLLLALAVPLLFVLILMRAQRWRLLFLPDARVRLGSTFVALNIGYMVNNVLPFQLGEIARAYTLGETEHVAKMRALSTIAVERVFDTLALLLLLGVLLPFIDLPRVAAVSAGLILAVASVGAIAIAWAAANRGRAERVLDWTIGLVPERFRATLRGWGNSVLDGLSALRSPAALLQIAGWTAISWATSAGILYLILEAFSLDVPITAAPFLLVATTFGFFVPSSPASIGVYDAITIRTLENVFNVSQEEATSFALVAHVIYLVPPTLLGATFFLLHHLSVRKLQDWGRQPAATLPQTPVHTSPEAPPPA